MCKKNILLVLLIVFLLTISLFFINTKDIAHQINSFDDCVNAGYPVMESYPRQCSTPEGLHFVEEVNDVEEFYGSSTNYLCVENRECVVAGCNNEICTGVDEGSMSSICIYPDLPLPGDLGYSCGCYNSECQWGKD